MTQPRSNVPPIMPVLRSLPVVESLALPPRAETWAGTAPAIKRKPLTNTPAGTVEDDETEPTDPKEDDR